MSLDSSYWVEPTGKTHKVESHASFARKYLTKLGVDNPHALSTLQLVQRNWIRIRSWGSEIDVDIYKPDKRTLQRVQSIITKLYKYLANRHATVIWKTWPDGSGSKESKSSLENFLQANNFRQATHAESLIDEVINGISPARLIELIVSERTPRE